MKKKILFLFILIISFIVTSCSRDPDNPVFATSADEIFEPFERKSFSFEESTQKVHKIDVNEKLSYEYFKDENEIYNLTIKSNSTSSFFMLDQSVYNVFEKNDNIFVVCYDEDYEESNTKALVLYSFCDGKLSEMLHILKCQEGFNQLYFFDNFYYLYFYNSSSLVFDMIKFDLNSPEDYVLTEFTQASNIKELVVLSPLDFYYIDVLSLYHFKENGDELIDINDFTFLESDVAHMYLNSNNELEFFDIKSSNYVVNSNLAIKKILFDKDSEGNVSITRDILFDKTYTLRYFTHLAYNDKVFFISNEFLGIIEYDITENKIYGYYDTNYTVDGIDIKENSVVILLKENGLKKIFAFNLK